MTAVLGIVAIAFVMVYFQIDWYLLLGPVIAIPLVVIADRRQQRFAGKKAEREAQEATKPLRQNSVSSANPGGPPEKG
jgi:H+/gluconate symporter-like permease